MPEIEPVPEEVRFRVGKFTWSMSPIFNCQNLAYHKAKVSDDKPDMHKEVPTSWSLF